MRVVVTGVGLVTPLGVGVAPVWRRLMDGHCGVRHVPALQGLPSEIAAMVPRGSREGEFNLSQHRLLAPGDELSMSSFIHFALAAAGEALDTAGWHPRTAAQRQRTGVAIGSGIGSLHDIVSAADTLRERGHRRISPHFIPRMLVNMAAGQVSIRAGLEGPAASPSTACATGAHAISDALHMLKSGAADVVLAGGAEACVEPLAVAGFSRLRALSSGYNASPQLASRPFDEARDGFVIGEGAAVMVLETSEHAARRGARAMAELCAVGLSADGYHATAPHPTGDGAFRAMKAALDACGLDADELDYVNAHATSTPAGDAVELAALCKLAGTRRSMPLLVSSTKGATGHLLGAAGAVESAFTVLSLRHQQVPPTINLTSTCTPSSPSIQHVTLGTPMSHRSIVNAMCNSFGFGGMNGSILFASCPDGVLLERR